MSNSLKKTLFITNSVYTLNLPGKKKNLHKSHRSELRRMESGTIMFSIYFLSILGLGGGGGGGEELLLVE